MASDDEIRKAVDRVRRMENLFDRVSESVRQKPEIPEIDEDLQDAVRTLSEYMDSGAWMSDYRLDEEGLLPPDLKRGVLSEDGLYDLLSGLPAPAEKIPPDAETLRFFAGHEQALPIYEALESLIRKKYPGAEKRIQKTQITFFQRHVFACVSFARVKRRSELPDPYLVLTLGLPYPLDSGRCAAKCEPYPGRWTTHIVLGSASDLDSELQDWLDQSYIFSEIK